MDPALTLDTPAEDLEPITELEEIVEVGPVEDIPFAAVVSTSPEDPPVEPPVEPPVTTQYQVDTPENVFDPPVRKSPHYASKFWNQIAKILYVYSGDPLQRIRLLAHLEECGAPVIGKISLVKKPSSPSSGINASASSRSTRAESILEKLVAHMLCLQIAKTNRGGCGEEDPVRLGGHLMILDDSFTFIKDTVARDSLFLHVTEFLEQKDWQVFVLAGDVQEWRLREAPFVRCLNTGTPVGYIVHREYIPVLLAELGNHLSQLISKGNRSGSLCSLEEKWQDIQSSGRWFTTDPRLGTSVDYEGTSLDLIGTETSELASHVSQNFQRVLHTATLQEECLYLAGSSVDGSHGNGNNGQPYSSFVSIEIRDLDTSLGDVMFRVATGYSLAVQTGRRLLIYMPLVGEASWTQPLRWSSLYDRLSWTNHLPMYSPLEASEELTDADALAPAQDPWVFYKDDQPTYQDIPEFPEGQNVMLHGNFKAELYFYPVRKEVCSMLFQLPASIQNGSLERVKREVSRLRVLANGRQIVVCDLSNAEMNPPSEPLEAVPTASATRLPETYFSSALKGIQLALSRRNQSFFVIAFTSAAVETSSEYECLRYATFSLPVETVYYYRNDIENLTGEEMMYLMANVSDHFVMSNTSDSWWTSYLARYGIHDKQNGSLQDNEVELAQVELAQVELAQPEKEIVRIRYMPDPWFPQEPLRSHSYYVPHVVRQKY